MLLNVRVERADIPGEPLERSTGLHRGEDGPIGETVAWTQMFCLISG